MKNILSRSQLPVLERFALSNSVLALDYDGTLAPIVEDPERAFMRPSTRELLSEVARVYKVIVVSGRAQADALKKLRGVGIFEVVGNHGVEPWHATERYVAIVRGWIGLLGEELARLPGVVLEDKFYTLAIHYRKATDRKRARAAILRAAGGLSGVRTIGGKQVVNLVPVGAPNKGIAVERERERLHCDTAIYVGDDETDEDVFRLDQPKRLLGIRVGSNQRSSAPYCITNQQSIDGLLRTLLKFRHGPPSAPSR